MRIRRRVIGAAAVLFLAIAGSGCYSPWTPTPRDGPPAPPPPPPQTFTLSGTVTEATSEGNVPIEGVTIEAAVCLDSSEHWDFALVSTDSDGRYTVPDMCTGRTFFWAYKTGYRDKDDVPMCTNHWFCYEVTIVGDTRVDVELVRVSEPSASSLASNRSSR